MTLEIAPRDRTTVDRYINAVAALPLPNDDTANRWNMRTATVAWLRSRKSIHTERAYFRDLSLWLAWCAATDLDPRNARRGDLDAYVADRLGDVAAPTRNRHLSTVSSWYDYLISNEVTVSNPAKVVDRETINRDDSPTIGLTDKQVTLFMRTARASTNPSARRDAALLGMLAELGLRVGEALRLNMSDFRHNQGHRTVRITGKGGKVRTLPVPAPLGRDLDTYLVQRATNAGQLVEELRGAVFVTATGKRLDQPAVFRLVRRVATSAGIPSAGQLSPHSLRHTVITVALDAGAPLRDVQDLAGHSDPRTTRRYDRGRGSLDRSPAT